MVIYFRSSIQNFGNWGKSGKTNALINLINNQNDIDKIYLYPKDLSEHEILINNAKTQE